MSIYVSVVISPPTITSPVVANVSHATLDLESFYKHASKTESDI